MCWMVLQSALKQFRADGTCFGPVPGADVNAPTAPALELAEDLGTRNSKSDTLKCCFGAGSRERERERERV